MSRAVARIRQAALRLYAERPVGAITVKELAEAAGVTRGTIYNNLDSLETLFEDVARESSVEMSRRVARAVADEPDPAARLAAGIRYYLGRTHEEPQWGAFIGRYAATSKSVLDLSAEPPMIDLAAGVASGRYQIRPEQMQSALALVTGVVVTSILLVLDGHRTWREAGSDAAELALRALGVPVDEARALATRDLPPLPTPQGENSI